MEVVRIVPGFVYIALRSPILTQATTIER